MVLKMAIGRRKTNATPRYIRSHFIRNLEHSDLPPGVAALKLERYPILKDNEIIEADARLFIAMRSRRRRYLILDSPSNGNVLVVERLETSHTIEDIKKVLNEGHLEVGYSTDPSSIHCVRSDGHSITFSPLPYYQFDDILLKHADITVGYLCNKLEKAAIPRLRKGKYKRGIIDEWFKLEKEKGLRNGPGENARRLLEELLDSTFYTGEEAGFLLGCSSAIARKKLIGAGVKTKGFNEFDKLSVDGFLRARRDRKPGDGGYYKIREVAELRDGASYHATALWLYRSGVPKKRRGEFDRIWVDRALKGEDIRAELVKPKVRPVKHYPVSTSCPSKRPHDPTREYKLQKLPLEFPGLDPVYSEMIRNSGLYSKTVPMIMVAKQAADLDDFLGLRALGYTGDLSNMKKVVDGEYAQYTAKRTAGK